MSACMCGDPYCGRCGGGNLEAEAAEESLFEALGREQATAEEYALVQEVGLAALRAMRSARGRESAQREALAAEAAYLAQLREHEADEPDV